MARKKLKSEELWSILVCLFVVSVAVAVAAFFDSLHVMMTSITVHNTDSGVIVANLGQSCDLHPIQDAVV